MISDVKQSDFLTDLNLLEKTQISKPAKTARKKTLAVATPATAAVRCLQSLLWQEDLLTFCEAIGAEEGGVRIEFAELVPKGGGGGGDRGSEDDETPAIDDEKLHHSML